MKLTPAKAGLRHFFHLYSLLQRFLVATTPAKCGIKEFENSVLRKGRKKLERTVLFVCFHFKFASK
ncbi:MAG: hypothetical protein DSZ30_02435 [Aquificaceae bacterium]|nr:MAG: hypothetical protein DSZ30_02435 [Aquificaceae bacterium]